MCDVCVCGSMWKCIREAIAKGAVCMKCDYTDRSNAWIIVIVKEDDQLLDNIILLTITTDYIQHLSLSGPGSF